MTANAVVDTTRLGIKTAFSGYVSSDIFGEYQFREMQQEQANVGLAERGERLPPFISSWHGQMAIPHHFTNTRVPLMPRKNTPKFKPNIILFDGYQTNTATAWITLAKATGATTILDAGHCDLGSLSLARQAAIVISTQRLKICRRLC